VRHAAPLAPEDGQVVSRSWSTICEDRPPKATVQVRRRRNPTRHAGADAIRCYGPCPRPRGGGHLRPRRCLPPTVEIDPTFADGHHQPRTPPAGGPRCGAAAHHTSRRWSMRRTIRSPITTCRGLEDSTAGGGRSALPTSHRERREFADAHFTWEPAREAQPTHRRAPHLPSTGLTEDEA